MKNTDFKEILHGRRSVKTYDPNVKISHEEMTDILTEATTAPSSINMQPWRFVVVDSPEGKEQMLKLAQFNSSQVTTSAAVIAVFGDMNSIEYAEEIYGKQVEQGFMPEDVKEKLLAMYAPLYKNMPAQSMKELVLIDASLVSMQIMLVARAHGYDTNPIGGFDRELIAEAFGLDKDRYVPVMLISIGKAAVEGRPSYRLPVDTVTSWK